MKTYSYPFDYDEFVFCPVEERPYSVYWLFDEADRLLYVGCTRKVNERLYLHDGYWSNATSLEFKGLVARVESVEYPDRDTARAAERAAIQAEAPLFNKAHNERREITREEYVATFGSPKTNQTPAALRGEAEAAGQTSVKSATPTDRECTEAGSGEPEALSGGLGWSLPAAPPVPGQMQLDLAPIVTPDYSPRASIAERYAEFESLNPWIIPALEKLTREWLAQGHERISIGMLTEIIRWTYGRTVSTDGLKINNSFRSRMVRRLIERNPQWADVFATRELRAA